MKKSENIVTTIKILNLKDYNLTVEFFVQDIVGKRY